MPHVLSPDRAYDREWAVTLLGKVVERLRADCAAEARGPQFERLKPFLSAGKGEVSYAEAARGLGLEE